MERVINKKTYNVNPKEFPLIIHSKYNYLQIRDSVGRLEREIGLICDLVEIFEGESHFLNIGYSHGGFVQANCTNKYICHNNYVSGQIYSVIRVEEGDELPPNIDNSIILYTGDIFNMNKYKLTDSNYNLYIPDKYHAKFIKLFSYYLSGTILDYQNLIHLVMIVKNAGDNFKNILEQNLSIIDRWTILDTGSTDNTIDIIKSTLSSKKGTLYCEPFINFKESRNRSIELAGTSCKYNLILDDTYIIKGNLREFLNEVRGDQLSDSFTLYIKGDDVIYGSNRVIKSATQLRYIYKIHEVINPDNNVNIIIPYDIAYIYDYKDDYMDKRTFDRKQLDIKLLNEMIEEEPDNPRHFYYLANTYKLLEDFEKTEEYYLKRINHKNPGFLNEKVDTYFELARLYNFVLNRPWELCEKTYMESFKLDNERPDSLYFIGIHYYLEGKMQIAFEYFKQAFYIGCPLDKQYNVKPTLSFHFLPKFLTPLCYQFEDYLLGEKCSKLYLEKNIQNGDYITINSWNLIFTHLNKMYTINKTNKIICFIADSPCIWTGSDITKTGVGGSETHVIELARYIHKITNYKVFVFCKTLNIEIFEGVEYRPIDMVYEFLTKNDIHTCFISRYHEYIPLAIKSNIINIYLFIHDISAVCNIIPKDNRLKIFCLTDWHKKQFCSIYPTLTDITSVFSHGIDINCFYNTTKKPFKFIYSSAAYRGLLYLLQMWNRILEIIPTAELHIFCNLEDNWAMNHYYDDMLQICKLVTELKNITLHGWVSKTVLASHWADSHIWLYPCTFQETFCLTAVEAAISKTLAIATPLAGLLTTIGDRGLLVDGSPNTIMWQDKVLDILKDVVNNKYSDLIEMNYKWAIDLSWDNQANRFVQQYINSN